MPTFSRIKNGSFVVFLVLALLFGCQCSRNAERVHKIAVIPKGTTHEFWKYIHAGAVKAEREFNATGIPVEIFWKGPLREDAHSEQIELLESFIDQEVSGIVLAPQDRKALIPTVSNAFADGIPVVVIDSGLDSGEFVSFAATDNYRGGSIAGEYLGKILEGEGNVILLRLMAGSASTEAREAGFMDAIGNFPGVRVLSSDQYAGATRESALTASQKLLQEFGGEINGIFTSNESATNGMLLALDSLDLPLDVKFVGFDGGNRNIEALRSGELDAIVVQDPFRMGYLGVKLLIDHLEGLIVERRFDTGASLVTMENIQHLEIQAMLFPPLEEYLQ